MALCRDVNFTQYGNEPLTQAAIAGLNTLPQFHGPRPVTRKICFAASPPVTCWGLPIAFILKPFLFGALPVTQLMTTYVPGVDYMTDQASWLAVQNGQGPFAQNQNDPNLQYMRNGRGLAAYVHVDVLFEAYFNACLVIDVGAPLDPNNPYVGSGNGQRLRDIWSAPLEDLGGRSLAAGAESRLVSEAVFADRHLRPQAFGGLVHMTITGQQVILMQSDAMHCEALSRVFAQHGTYFMPHAFPEGCPHTSLYGQGHGVRGGRRAPPS